MGNEHDVQFSKKKKNYVQLTTMYEGCGRQEVCNLQHLPNPAWYDTYQYIHNKILMIIKNIIKYIYLLALLGRFNCVQ